MYSCLRCDTTALKKSTIMKHIYTHIKYEEYPYKCPIPGCRWNGKFLSEYKYHSVSKKHVTNRNLHSSIDDSQPIKNPARMIILENEWFRREEEAEPYAKVNIPVPEPPSQWIPPMEARTKSPCSTPLRDEFSSPGSSVTNIRNMITPITPTLPIAEPMSPKKTINLDQKTNSPQAVPLNPMPSTSNSTAMSTPSINEEIVTTRKDLTHHFEKLINHVDSRGRDQQTVIERNSQSLNVIDQRLNSLEDLVKAGLLIKFNSIPATRIKLGGLIDEFLRAVAPLHNHPNMEPYYVSTCALCVCTEKLLFEAISVSSPNLLMPTHRE